MALDKGLKMKVNYLKIFSTGLLLAGLSHLSAQDFLSVGTRGGVSFGSGQNRFWQAEAFAETNLPWQWNFYSDWRCQPRIDVSAGWLKGQNDNAFVGTVGPLVELRKRSFPLALDGGSSPTILSRDQFGTKNFGERFQFTSHVGLTWYITNHISVGYRFQHMSNAGLAHPNPGLNLQVLELSYIF